MATSACRLPPRGRGGQSLATLFSSLQLLQLATALGLAMALRGQRAAPALAILAAVMGQMLLSQCHTILELPIRPVNVMGSSSGSSSATTGNFTGRQAAPTSMHTRTVHAHMHAA